nr:hypothetical protein GCM10020092_039550 [Actinoplanes digitatis]
MRRALHRLLSGSAVALLAAAVVSAPGTPALAADPAVRLHFPDISVVGKDTKTSALFAWIDVPGTAPTAIGKLTVSVDTAGVDSIATVEAFSEFEDIGGEFCDRAGTVITCELDGPIELEGGTNLLPLVPLSVTAKPGAAQDAEGKLAFTARIDGGPAVTAESTVAIGEGVDLARRHRQAGHRRTRLARRGRRAGVQRRYPARQGRGVGAAGLGPEPDQGRRVQQLHVRPPHDLHVRRRAGDRHQLPAVHADGPGDSGRRRRGQPRERDRRLVHPR